jgi:hypothetical protein
MNELQQKDVQCPYCGESINILIDCSIPQQNYIEDCQVCCRPITIDVTMDQEGDFSVVTSHENE